MRDILPSFSYRNNGSRYDAEVFSFLVVVSESPVSGLSAIPALATCFLWVLLGTLWCVKQPLLIRERWFGSGYGGSKLLSFALLVVEGRRNILG
jgi:hypothetical protein